MVLPSHKEQHRKLKQALRKAQGRLGRIATIIEAVDQRAMACDGPVTPTLKEMTQDEITEIYDLARGTE